MSLGIHVAPLMHCIAVYSKENLSLHLIKDRKHEYYYYYYYYYHQCH